MATGNKAFAGKSQASLIAAILDRDPPPMSSLQPMAPPALERLVKKCLAKEPGKRWQAASDLCDELTWIRESGGQTATSTVVRPSRVRKRIAWSVALLAVGVLRFWRLLLLPLPWASATRVSRQLHQKQFAFPL